MALKPTETRWGPAASGAETPAGRHRPQAGMLGLPRLPDWGLHPQRVQPWRGIVSEATATAWPPIQPRRRDASATGGSWWRSLPGTAAASADRPTGLPRYSTGSHDSGCCTMGSVGAWRIARATCEQREIPAGWGRCTAEPAGRGLLLGRPGGKGGASALSVPAEGALGNSEGVGGYPPRRALALPGVPCGCGPQRPRHR